MFSGAPLGDLLAAETVVAADLVADSMDHHPDAWAGDWLATDAPAPTDWLCLTETSAIVESWTDKPLLGGLDSDSLLAGDPMATEIIFADSGVEGLDQLLGSLLERDAHTRFEVVILDAAHDGISQISQTLAGQRDVAAIHVLSHSTAGTVQLGGTLLTSSQLSSFAAEIAGWGNSLSADADILFYGCDLAGDSSGQELLESVAGLTGADVAASIDVTGHAALGGDWDLEYQAGRIETGLVFSLDVLADWNHTLDLAASGGESLVNANATGTQATTAFGGDNVAMDADGNYVVVWEDNRSGNLDVYARVFNADGSARTGDLLVNTYTANAQGDAAVAMDVDGNFVVTWSSNLQDGNRYGVYFQRFDRVGNALGMETRVNDVTFGQQDLPSIGMADDGSFVISFSDLNVTTGDVFAQRYNSSGSALGSNFRVNSTTIDTQYYSSVDVDRDGDFVVVWEANGQDGGGWGIYGQRFNSSGLGQGSEFRVNTTTIGDQLGATVDMAADGSFVVAWDSVGQDGSGIGVYAQRFDAAGIAQGAEIPVNTYTAGDQHVPAIDVAADGRFLISWQSTGQDGSVEGTYAHEFDASGSTIGNEFLVNSTLKDNQHYSSVAYDGERAVVAWSGNGTGDTLGVFSQQFSIDNRIVVTTTSDVADGNTSSIVALLADQGADGLISLREAIEAANNTANRDATTPDEIWFSISTADSGHVDPDALPGSGDEYWVIRPQSYLGDILDPVMIDATTQPGYSGRPVIELDGSDPLNSGASAGLNLRTSDSVIRGFAIHSFADDGIEIDGTLTAGVAANNIIEYNWIGVDAEGNAAGVGDVGLLITDGASGNIVRYNVIANSGGAGILIRENLIAGTSDNLIYGNYIGTDVTGTADMGNAGYGIQILDSFDNTIGGSNFADRNVISGNNRAGISIWGSLSTGNTVIGNYIGTNEAGTGAIGNTDDGVRIGGGAHTNTIGGDRTAGQGNVISGNLDDGIEILNAGANDNLVYGNYIGTDASGTLDIGNLRHGVVLYDGVQGNRIGGTGTGQGNIISGNSRAGIVIDGNGLATTTANVIAGNYIGVDVTGTAALGNGTSGVEIFDMASGNTVGGLAAAAGNVISGQGQYGIVISNADGNTIRRNFVGTDASGTAAIGNGTDGIWVFQSDNTIIGGSGAGNVVAGSGDSGIEVGSSTGVMVQGNFVGTDTMAAPNLGNMGSGIVLFGTASGNLIGGIAAGEGNVVAHSGNDGIYLDDIVGGGNSLLGNLVYDSGGLGIELTEAGPAWGVTANDSGDADSGANNLQNFPVLTAVATNGSQIKLDGSINSTANSYFRIEFFANTVDDASGHGEGQRYLGYVNVSTNGSGNAPFAVWLAQSVAAGEYITATATKTDATYSSFSDTSEFAQSVAAAGLNTAPALDNLPIINFDPVVQDAGPPVGAVGMLVSSLVDLTGGGGRDNVTDPDAGAVTGIALIQASTGIGTWYYSIDDGATGIC